MAAAVTPYTRGRAFEYTVRDVLRAAGYVVIRSAGSKGPADLTAHRPGEHLAIQAKRTGGCGRAERSALITWADRAGLRPVLAHAEDGKVVFVSLSADPWRHPG